MRAVAGILVLAVAAGCQSPSRTQLSAEVRCEPEVGLRHQCTVQLADDARPLLGATVLLTADMPSMPLVHHVPPATCVAGKPPGSYMATLDFEMPGRWMLGIRITAPRTDYLTREVEIGRP